MYFLFIGNSPEQNEEIQKPHYNPYTACLIQLDFDTKNKNLSTAFSLTYNKIIKSHSEALT
jgi:hypothetical protein